MTKEEFDSLYFGKAIHCDTEEKANHFLALADSVGYKWFSGSGITGRNFWEDYEKETYYHITNDGVLFGKINYIKQDDYQIIEYQLQPKFKAEEPTYKEETIDDIIDEIRAKWSEIDILLNQLEKKKGRRKYD